jgi:hypothetical protein
MTDPKKIAVIVLSVLFVITMTLLANLTFFAAKGARYTAADGESDRLSSATRDALLAEQIQELRVRVDALDAK